MDDVSEYFTADMGDGHSLYVVPCSLVLSLMDKGKLINWRHNRPPDKNRVIEIRQRMTSTGHASGTIKLAQLVDEVRTLVVYDGLHRLLALSEGIVMTVLFDVLVNVTEERVKDEFCTINRSVPVPELYIAPNVDKDVLDEIENYVHRLTNKYPGMVSTSKSCQKPHFNIDVTKNDVYELYVMFSPTSAGRITKALSTLNNMYMRTYVTSLSPSVHAKCKSNGLYMFGEGRLINRDKFRLALYITDNEGRQRG